MNIYTIVLHYKIKLRDESGIDMIIPYIDTEMTGLLLFAMRNRCINIARLIIDMDNYNFNYRDSSGNTLQMLAIYNLCEPIALYLLQKHGDIYVTAMNIYNETAMILACCYDLSELAIYYIQNYTDMLEHHDIDGNTALIWAVGNEMADVATLILQSKYANINKVNGKGDTALIWACRNRNSIHARLIIEYAHEQANKYVINNDGEDARYYAAMFSMRDIVKLIDEN